MADTKRSPNDPGRRARIIESALEVIARRGVHNTTHRAIAVEAEVPLGSMTYYFRNLTEIIELAFTHLVHEMSHEYEDTLSAARNIDEACEAFTDLISTPKFMTPTRAQAVLEMYAYGSFNQVVGNLRADWMQASRKSLTQHFSEEAASGLDALLEGWTLHGFFTPGQLCRDTILHTVRAIAVGVPQR